MSFFAELRRRNVIRVGIAYCVVGWVAAQVAEFAFENFGAPAWVLPTLVVVLLIGLPLALIFAWAFEMTPEGLKRESEVAEGESITLQTGRKLDRAIIGILVVAVAWFAWDKFLAAPDTGQQADAGATDKSVAVLPFVAMSSGPDDEYFADGLTEEILNSLAQLPELLVTARTSAFSFKGMDLPIPEVAGKLGVAHVVEGSVRRAGETMRITAQLIRASDGFHLWSDTYDRPTADSFGVQGEIAEKVAAALDVVLDEDLLEQMNNAGLSNPEAFIASQKGVELYRHAHELAGTEQLEMLALANEQFDAVLALEPESATTWFRHADYFIHQAVMADAPVNDQQRMAIDNLIDSAKSDLRNVTRFAPNEGIRLTMTLEYALIANEWRRLPELYRSAAMSESCVFLSWSAGIPPFLEPIEDALVIWEKIRACDPLNFYSWTNLASVQMTAGDIQAALATASDGSKVLAHRQIADVWILALMIAGDFDAALATNERLIESAEMRKERRLRVAAARGDTETAQRLRKEITDANGPDALDIVTWAMLGEREQVNRAAAATDARPLGVLRLLDETDRCKCGSLFDLEFTPNFARLVEEAQLAWPPRSPASWPLKDW